MGSTGSRVAVALALPVLGCVLWRLLSNGDAPSSQTSQDIIGDFRVPVDNVAQRVPAVPVAKRSAVPVTCFEVSWDDGTPAVNAQVYAVSGNRRVVRPESWIGSTDESGVVNLDTGQITDSQGLAYAAFAGGSHALFKQVSEQHWKSVLTRMENVLVRLRLTSGKPLPEPCTVVASQLPWAARRSEEWFGVATTDWLPNAADSQAAIHVTHSKHGEVYLRGLFPGTYLVETSCSRYVATRGLSEVRPLTVPGGPYDVVFRPVMACVIGVDSDDVLSTTYYKIPRGLSKHPPYAFRALRRLEDRLKRTYPVHRWLAIAAVDERMHDLETVCSMSVVGCSAQRGVWKQEAQWFPIAEVRASIVSVPVVPGATVGVTLNVMDFTGHAVVDGYVALVSAENDKLRHVVRADRKVFIPRGDYRVRSTCRLLEQAFSDKSVSVSEDGPLQLTVPEPLLPCRIRIITGDLDCGCVRVTIYDGSGVALWNYSCEAQEQPIAWVPAGSADIVVDTPGWMPLRVRVNIDPASSVRPLDVPVTLERVFR
jgi:hypothetical protein